MRSCSHIIFFFFFQAEDGIRDLTVTGVQTCALPIYIRSCWDGEAAPVAQQAPVVLGELGQNDRGHAFVDSLMDWMDARNGSYLAWTWDVWGSEWDLIQSYDGTPTAYGAAFKARFAL